MLVAQLSDPHVTAPGALLYGRVDTGAMFAQAVAAVAALKPAPDVTVITGDLVGHEEADEYQRLGELLAPLRMPVFVIPGNHDDRDLMRAAFRSGGYLPGSGFLQYAVEDYPLRLVALDTHIPGEPGGTLCAERLAWLDRTLAAAPERPTLVMMHHPPFATGIALMDRSGLDPGAAAGLAEIVRRSPQVERILCGHLHRAIDRRFAGTIAGTAPSTAHQFQLALDPEARLRYTLEPPGYQLHLWREDTGLVSHTALVGEWPGPYSLRPPE